MLAMCGVVAGWGALTGLPSYRQLSNPANELCVSEAELAALVHILHTLNACTTLC